MRGDYCLCVVELIDDMSVVDAGFMYPQRIAFSSAYSRI